MVLAEGETVHIVCDASMQKCLMPERYAAPIRAAIRISDRDEQGEVEGQD
jgi:ribosomal protein L21E